MMEELRTPTHISERLSYKKEKISMTLNQTYQKIHMDFVWLPQQGAALKKYQSRETLAFQREEMCSHGIAWER